MPVVRGASAQLKALTFDVFGTVVDWRGSIINEGQQLTDQTGVNVDWPRFADAWRAGYGVEKAAIWHQIFQALVT